MNYDEVPNKLAELYGLLSVWCFNHQLETDLIIVSAVIGSCIVALKRGRRNRRRLHRFLWGTLMGHKYRDRYQKMRFEDALLDAAMEMVHRGDMNYEEEDRWYRYFAEKMEMDGFKPQKDTKRSISRRLKSKLGLKPVNWPGDKPGVTPDKSYDPTAPIPDGLVSSKYKVA